MSNGGEGALFTDTDSLCCEIRTDDLYADMMDSLDHYDTSNFDPKLPQYNADNRRKLGKFKSETGSVPPREFAACARKCIVSKPQRKISKRPKASKSINLRSKAR